MIIDYNKFNIYRPFNISVTDRMRDLIIYEATYEWEQGFIVKFVDGSTDTVNELSEVKKRYIDFKPIPHTIKFTVKGGNDRLLQVKILMMVNAFDTETNTFIKNRKKIIDSKEFVSDIYSRTVDFVSDINYK